jgi:hypothetical protein
VFFLLTLPFRLFFGILCAVVLLPVMLLLLPFLILRLLLKTVVALVVLPFALLAGGIGIAVALFAMSIAILVPLLPFAFFALVVWAVVHASRPAASSWS